MRRKPSWIMTASVFRTVELANLAEDAELAEHAYHAEGAGLVRHDGHHALADRLVPQQRAEDAHERHGRGDLAGFGRLELRLEGRQGRDFQRLGTPAARRQAAAQRRTAGPQILQLRAVFRQADERYLCELLVRDRKIEAVAELPQRGFPHLLLLVRDVLAFAGLAHAVALDGLGEDRARREPGSRSGHPIGPRPWI